MSIVWVSEHSVAIVERAVTCSCLLSHTDFSFVVPFIFLLFILAPMALLCRVLSRYTFDLVFLFSFSFPLFHWSFLYPPTGVVSFILTSSSPVCKFAPSHLPYFLPSEKCEWRKKRETRKQKMLFSLPNVCEVIFNLSQVTSFNTEGVLIDRNGFFLLLLLLNFHIIFFFLYLYIYFVIYFVLFFLIQKSLNMKLSFLLATVKMFTTLMRHFESLFFLFFTYCCY